MGDDLDPPVSYRTPRAFRGSGGADYPLFVNSRTSQVFAAFRGGVKIYVEHRLLS